MKISKLARREAKRLFQACQANGLLDESRVRQVVDQVLQHKPRGYLAILNHLQRLVKLDLDRRSARIESATSLDAALEARIKQQLAARYGQGLTYQFVTNPALIGGVRIKVGSDVYDATVQGRLAQLQQSFEAA